ncbi:hypothetical protein BD289DRAFT_503707 [Coniella lustricola]|uniref:Uncharacterized protein n=1 Tax=Coniella lustricola TaxID=2025994 RepID=A0A2T3AGU4_9PEZI|nr:hypothetical protein BD289DRAFT_503707 [Coniella lustricola]
MSRSTCGSSSTTKTRQWMRNMRASTSCDHHVTNIIIATMSAVGYSTTEEMELKDSDYGRRSPRRDQPDPLERSTEIFRAKEAQHRRDCRIILVILSFTVLSLVLALILGTLYILRVSAPSPVGTITATAWTTLWTASISTTTTTAVSTQPTTETVTSTSLSVSTTTSTNPTRRPRQTQLVTAVSTITLSITTISASTSLTTLSTGSTTPPSTARYCVPGGEYGGLDLHELNGGYDAELAWQIRYAVLKGLNIGNEDFLMVGLRSVFECVNAESVSLISPCRDRFTQGTSGNLPTANDFLKLEVYELLGVRKATAGREADWPERAMLKRINTDNPS